MVHVHAVDCGVNPVSRSKRPVRLSIVIPTFNEVECISDCLRSIQALRARGHEVILVDGGSTDGTAEAAALVVERIIRSERGRAAQMNRGAAAATGDVLVFLHADTILPEDADAVLRRHVTPPAWGRFDVRLSGDGFAFRVIEFFMNLRSRLTGIATGDQAMFVTRDLFCGEGGFADVELMEDIELSVRLKRRMPPTCLRERVITSSRRWESDGMLRTVFRMWRLRLRYAFGVKPSELAREYDRGQANESGPTMKR